MADSAADVPTKYDVLIDGLGYIFADDTDSPYFSRHSTYTQTPTFLERQNISGNYGDNNQSFYMTLTQHNWAEGEEQRYIDVGNPDSVSKAFKLLSADPITVPGHVTPLPASIHTNSSVMAWGTPRELVAAPTEPLADDTVYTTLSGNVYLAADDGLYQYNVRKKAAFKLSTATWTRTKQLVGMIVLGGRVANSGTGLGYSETVLVGSQKWTPGAVTGAMTTFLDTAEPGPMCLSNNIIFAFDGVTLRQFDIVSGVSTILYQFKDQFGNLAKGEPGQIVAVAGKVYFLSAHRNNSLHTELWSYDGSSAHQELELPRGSLAYNLCESQGILWIGGLQEETGHATATNVADFPAAYACVWVYDGSNFSVAWKSAHRATITSVKDRFLQPPVASYQEGIVFVDNTDTGNMKYMDVNGVIISLYQTSQDTPTFIASFEGSFYTVSRAAGSTEEYPGHSYANATVLSSQFDGGSALMKYWKSVRVDFTTVAANDSVDLYYALDDGSQVLIQAGIVSGTEYVIDQTTQNVSIQVILKPDPTTIYPTNPAVGPILKRITVKGVPILDTFRRNSYLLDLSGNKRADPPQHVICRNQQPHPLDGQDMASNLRTSMLKKTPLTIVDRFGTFTGIIEPDQTTFEEVRQDYGRGEFKGTIVVREV